MFQLVILASLLPLFCKSEQVYIIPMPDSPCPEEICYTLMQYINRTSLYQSSNVTQSLIFMKGEHTLGTDFSITTIKCFSMSLYDNSSSCSITCTSSSRMALSSIETVVISGLSFINCGGNTARFVNSFILEGSKFIMDPPSYLYRGRAWSVIQSEKLTIDGCFFTTNAASFRGGALYISAVTNAIITLCTFNNNTAAGGGGQGGAVYITNAMNSIINGSVFFNNTLLGGGAEGGAVYVSARNSIIYRSIFTNNTASGGAAKGGALCIDAPNSIISGTTFTNNTARGGRAEGGALYVNAMNSVINESEFRSNMAVGGGAQGGALYVRARNLTIGMSMFVNNTATHGAPWYINASTSNISHDATYEGLGLEWQHLDVNMTLNDGICGKGLSVNCNLPQPPNNGNVNYTTTLEGSQAAYKCDNGYIPSGEFKTTCYESGHWFPDPMELTCIEETFNCTSLPSLPINGVLLNLTSTSATIGCVTDDVNNASNTITVMCVNQDVWSHLEPMDFINCSLLMETISYNTSVTYRESDNGTLILAVLTTVTSVLILLIIFIVTFMVLMIVFQKKDTSTTPIYEEIQPSYSQAPNESNKEDLELQDNTAYRVTTTLKLQENAAYQTTVDVKFKSFELHENAAYTSTTYEHFELRENTAYCNTVPTQK